MGRTHKKPTLKTDKKIKHAVESNFQSLMKKVNKK